MGPLDAAVWRDFLTVSPRSIEWVQYDVALGGRGARHARGDADELRMWETLLKKRVDAVAMAGGELWTCEVKPLANMSALGQAITYAFLWDAEHPGEPKARAVVICSRVDEDVEAVFKAYGVLVLVVRPADGEAPAALVAVIGPLKLPSPG
jgi:hypothetical protein